VHIQTYLERIEFSHRITPDLATLRGLHLAHMLAVPFENLDIGLKRPIHIDEQSLWKKIVVDKRGGFCYELNGLFAWLLNQIGFQVTHLNGRVFNKDGNPGIEFDHLALLVNIPGLSTRWLADVGFGDSFTQPLNVEEKGEQTQGLRAYRLEHSAEGYIVWQQNYDGVWKRQYGFDLRPRKFPDEYETACVYHQTSPNSSFTRGSIISRATDNGRISLEEGRLIVTINGNRVDRRVESRNDYDKLLKEHFGIVLQKEMV